VNAIKDMTNVNAFGGGISIPVLSKLALYRTLTYLQKRIEYGPYLANLTRLFHVGKIMKAAAS